MKHLLKLICARFRFKRMMTHILLRLISSLGDHLLHATEHLQRCFLYRIRSMQYYNEIMEYAEKIATECSVLRDEITHVGVLRHTLSFFVQKKRAILHTVDKLRHIYRLQGATRFNHVVQLEFTHSAAFDWWQAFVDTSFTPLTYTVYVIRKSNQIVPHKINRSVVDTGEHLRYAVSHPDEETDIERIRKMLACDVLENRCYSVKHLPSPTPAAFFHESAKDADASPPAVASVATAPTLKDARQSLIEHIHGAQVFTVINKKYVIAMRGYFGNDSFQMMGNHLLLLSKKQQLRMLIQNNSVMPEAFTAGWLQQLSLRDQLVHTVHELNDMCIRSFQKLQELKGKTISTLVKEFISSPLHVQREILTLFLLTEHDSDTQYLAYLMYDMISQESYLLKQQPHADEIYNNLHWMIRKRFRVVIENISQYTKQLTTFNESDINYESRIVLMKADDAVKRKAMAKFKEVQSKSGNDSNHKAQQYLDGILRVPFGIYKREHIFSFLKHFRERLKMYCTQYCSSSAVDTEWFELHKQLVDRKDITFDRIDTFIDRTQKQKPKPKQTQTQSQTQTQCSPQLGPSNSSIQQQSLQLSGRSYAQLSATISQIKKKLRVKKLVSVQNGTKTEVKLRRKINGVMTKMTPEDIATALGQYCADLSARQSAKWARIRDIVLHLQSSAVDTATATASAENATSDMQHHLQKQVVHFQKEWVTFKDDAKTYMTNVDKILEASVFGHSKAKRSIKQVIAQWITGEPKGYCFGFEGPPGTGKTSLAKNGVSKCLTDINGKPRPFAFIALGGSSNGSTLEGHSYTYVGSTWGRIVDILMETECMNPIIYIDELDKISRTEQGRELVGILTHMTDSTQNTEFMDKYFSGVRIDLSRVLFVFSYNDPDLLDPILRDRIHVVKFSPLKQADKHEVSKLHLIPEILKTIGLSRDDIVFPDEVIDYIIDNYTAEGGVRRLKEKLFEISRDLNIRHIVDPDHFSFPYTVTTDFLKNDLFQEHPIIHTKCILETPRVGLVNGMYATSLGVGGITIIECFVVPKTTFLSLELTGQQGDVMKESMSVAKTVAWNLLTDETKSTLYARATDNSFGLHIHCPDGGTPKDGPSAGTAITISIVSALLNLPVNNKVAITGEINLNGQVCQIGGLDTKIRGAKKAGVEVVLFPKSNEHDLQTIMKYYSPFEDQKLKFVMVETVWDVLPYVFATVDYNFQTF